MNIYWLTKNWYSSFHTKSPAVVQNKNKRLLILVTLILHCWPTTTFSLRSTNLHCVHKKCPPCACLKIFEIGKLCAIMLMNIYFNKITNFSKISLTVMEIPTFNKWYSKIYHFQKHASLLMFHWVDCDVSIDTIVTLAKQKQNGVYYQRSCFNSSRKRLQQLMNDHTASLKITVNV